MADKDYKKAGRKYWLKLKDDFFQLKHVRMMGRKGYAHIIAYEKMMLSTIKTDCIFEYHSELFDSITDEIAECIDEDISTVNEVLRILKAYKLIEERDGNIMFLEANDNVGSESESAQRVREFREKKALQCNDNVKNCNDIKEKDIEEDTVQQKTDSWSVFSRIINGIIPQHKFRNPQKCSELLEMRTEETGLTDEEIGNCFWKYASDYQKSDTFAESRWQYFPQVEMALGDRYEETLKPFVTEKAKAKKAQQKQVEEAEDEHIDLWGED